MKIAVIGEITIDHYPQQNRSFVGGISLNFAVQAKRCGAEQVSLISRVGSDEAGQHVLARLRREKVNASFVAVVPGKTAEITIHLTPDLERIFPPGSFHRHVLADFHLTPDELTFSQQQDVVVTLFDNSQPGLFFEQLLTMPKLTGWRVADFGDWADYARDYKLLLAHLKVFDVAFISGDEAAVEALQPISQMMAGAIVVTLGAKGSVGLVNGRSCHQLAIAVNHPLDPTGCGDAFQAAFVVNYWQTGDIEVALQQGAEQAAIVLQHYGAIG
jgi:fructoselysine 6-kinase